MYEFNYWLLEHLDEVTGVARFKIGLMSGKSKDFMRHVLLESHDIKMGDLLDICNALRIPVGCFFYVRGTESVTRPTPTFAYEAASFDTTVIGELLKGDRGRYGVPTYKVMNAAGHEDCRNRKWASDITRITAYTLVDLCNGMCINLSQIISCPMKSLPSCFTAKQFADRCESLKQANIPMNLKYNYPTRKERNETKRREEEQLKQMADTMAEMQKTLAAMQSTLREQQQRIDALSSENRHLREMGHISLAASPKVGYEKSEESNQ